METEIMDGLTMDIHAEKLASTFDNFINSIRVYPVIQKTSQDNQIMMEARKAKA